MTLVPALASSAARIPPAAPIPTITTSVFSIAMTVSYSARGFGLQAGHRQSRKGLAALHVGRGEHRLRAGKADQTPAGEVLVAAVDRVGEHAFDRVGSQRIEECN